MLFCVKNAQKRKCVTDKQTNQLTQWFIQMARNIIIYLIPYFPVLNTLKTAQK